MRDRTPFSVLVKSKNNGIYTWTLAQFNSVQFVRCERCFR